MFCMFNMFFFNLLKFFFYTYMITMVFLIIILMNLINLHPMVVSLYLIFYTLMLCFLMNMLKSSFWYSYILYLILVGGVMILFMYFTSLVSNEKSFYFKMNFKSDCYLYIIFLLIFSYIMNEMINFEMKEFMNLNFKKNYLFMIKILYMNLYMDMNIFLMLYLLLMMIFVVLICYMNQIPLRKLKI